MKPDPTQIHPELQQAAKSFPSMTYGRHNLWLLNLLMRLMPAPKPGGEVAVENRRIPGPAGSLKIRLYRPKNLAAPAPALLWMHGGGYVLGRPEQDDEACLEFVNALGITVVSVDYRCAPQHPFPAALEDCYTALAWLAANAQTLGVDPARLAVGGRSAGAGLAAALAQMAHDRKEVALVFQLLVYPMLDDRTVTRTDLQAEYLVWNRESNRFGWESYLGGPAGAESVPDYAVPARRENLQGLPPAWVGVGTLDLFHDEDSAYARRLQQAGVGCELHLVPGAFHGFDVFDAQLPVVLAFRQAQIKALETAFAGG